MAMSTFKKVILVVAHALIFALSIYAFSYPFIARHEEKTISCHDIHLVPALIVGSLGFIISTIGLINAIWEANLLKSIYMAMWLGAFLVMVGIMMFNFPAMGYHSEKIESMIQRDLKTNGNKWGDIKNCFIQKQVCENLLPVAQMDNIKGVRIHDEFKSIQKSCCRPPMQCSFDRNLTLPLNHEKIDCENWNDDKEKLCYNCKGCKKAYVYHQEKALYNSILLSFAALIFLMIAFLFMIKDSQTSD